MRLASKFKKGRTEDPSSRSQARLFAQGGVCDPRQLSPAVLHDLASLERRRTGPEHRFVSDVAHRPIIEIDRDQADGQIDGAVHEDGSMAIAAIPFASGPCGSPAIVKHGGIVQSANLSLNQRFIPGSKREPGHGVGVPCEPGRRSGWGRFRPLSENSGQPGQKLSQTRPSGGCTRWRLNCERGCPIVRRLFGSGLVPVPE